MLVQASMPYSPLADDSIDCVVTSVPYYGPRDYEIPDTVWDEDPECAHKWETYLRPGISGGKSSQKVRVKGRENFQDVPPKIQAYCTKCGAWKGQHGQEPTLEEYIRHEVAIFEDVRRALKPTGTMFLNIADSKNGSGGAGGDYNPGGLREGQPKWKPHYQDNMKPTDLMLVPTELAKALRDAGWYLESAIIWRKNNGFPEPHHRRPTKSYEFVFFMAKTLDYFWNFEEAKKIEPYVRDVWDIPTSGYKGAHFATMPPKLAERCILLGSKPGDIVFDPFVGSGTTVMVAHQTGRRGIGTDLGWGYLKMAMERTGLEALRRWGLEEQQGVIVQPDFSGLPLFGGTL